MSLLIYCLGMAIHHINCILAPLMHDLVWMPGTKYLTSPHSRGQEGWNLRCIEGWSLRCIMGLRPRLRFPLTASLIHCLTGPGDNRCKSWDLLTYIWVCTAMKEVARLIWLHWSYQPLLRQLEQDDWLFFLANFCILIKVEPNAFDSFSIKIWGSRTVRVSKVEAV